MRTTENVNANRMSAPFEPSGPVYRVACRLFTDFSKLPRPVIVSLEPYAHLFDPEFGPLGLSEREAIAAAVSALVGGAAPFVAATGPNAALTDARTSLLAGFAVKLLGRSFAVEAADLDRLERSALSADEIAAAAEAAFAFHLVARLIWVAQGHRPAMCATLALAARRPAFAA